MPINTKKWISGILTTYLSILPVVNFAQQNNLNMQKTKGSIEEKINKENDGKRVLTVNAYYDEEFEACNDPGKIPSYIDFASMIFESHKYQGKSFGVQLKLNSVTKIKTDDGWTDLLALFKDFELTTPKNSDISILFSNQEKYMKYYGMTDKEESYVVLSFNKGVSAEYLLLHELRHLFGAADRDVHHPDYSAISNMSYRNPFTSFLDETNTKIIFSNKDRNFNYQSEEKKELENLVQKYPDDKEMIRRAYLLEKNAAINGDFISNEQKANKFFSSLGKKHPEEALFDYHLATTEYCLSKHKKAMLAATSAIKKDEKMGKAYLLLADITYRMSLQKEPQLIEKALSLSCDPELISDAAQLYSDFEEHDKVYSLRKGLTTAFPLLQTNYLNLAKTCVLLGKNKEAEECFEKALEYTNGENFALYESAGEFYLAQKKYDKSIALLSVANTIDEKRFGYFIEANKESLTSLPLNNISKKNQRHIKKWLRDQ